MLGRVHPERANVCLPRTEFTGSDGAKSHFICDASQFTVVLDDSDVHDPHSAKIRGEQIALMIVSALGLSNGSGYSVEVVNVVDGNGNSYVFGVRPYSSELEEDLRMEPMGEVYNDAVNLSSHNIFFRLAVSDYGRALKDEGDCATYCYRAIDSIKSSFSDNDKKGWKLMHEALNTNKDDIYRLIKFYADPARHGNWVKVPDTDSKIRWDMLEYTRNTLVAFMIYTLTTP